MSEPSTPGARNSVATADGVGAITDRGFRKLTFAFAG